MTLELGGKNAIIVCPDMDLEAGREGGVVQGDELPRGGRASRGSSTQPAYSCHESMYAEALVERGCRAHPRS